MGGVSSRGGSWEVNGPTSIVQLKMEDAYSLAMWLKFNDENKLSKQKDEDPLALSSSKWHWHNHVKTHSSICVDIQILQLLRGGIN
jgi:hypothetical protein